MVKLNVTIYTRRPVIQEKRDTYSFQLLMTLYVFKREETVFLASLTSRHSHKTNPEADWKNWID